MDHEQWNAYADEYHEYVISPLRDGVRNPLLGDLARIRHAKKLSVADLGCGRGELLGDLASRFKQVHAIDFSDKMLAIAQTSNHEHNNIIFSQHDLRNLDGVKVDVAICVNSILHPHFTDCEKALSAIHNAITENGYFFGIFPSTEALLWTFELIYEREYEKYHDEARALRNARRIAERGKYTFMNGVYEDGEERQKLFTQVELQRMLTRAGFVDIEFDKVLYPWEKVGDFEQFPGEPELWDWYVRARKN